MMMTKSLKLFIFQKVYIIDRFTKQLQKITLCQDQKILLVVYIRISDLISSSYFFDKEFSNMSKINHTQEILNGLVMFRIEFRDRQDVSDETQTRTPLIKYEPQNSI